MFAPFIEQKDTFTKGLLFFTSFFQKFNQTGLKAPSSIKDYKQKYYWLTRFKSKNSLAKIMPRSYCQKFLDNALKRWEGIKSGLTINTAMDNLGGGMISCLIFLWTITMMMTVWIKGSVSLPGVQGLITSISYSHTSLQTSDSFTTFS